MGTFMQASSLVDPWWFAVCHLTRLLRAVLIHSAGCGSTRTSLPHHRPDAAATDTAGAA
jgi:hypothetical protein